MTDLAKKVQEHWLAGLLVLGVTCVSTTWIVANDLLVKPRDFEISRRDAIISDLQNEIEDLQALRPCDELPTQGPDALYYEMLNTAKETTAADEESLRLCRNSLQELALSVLPTAEDLQEARMETMRTFENCQMLFNQQR